jgi:hypothetical protein
MRNASGGLAGGGGSAPQSAAAAAAAAKAAQAAGEAWAHHLAGVELAIIVNALLRWQWTVTPWWTATYWISLVLAIKRRVTTFSAEQLDHLTEAGRCRLLDEVQKADAALRAAYGELRPATS